MGLVVPGVPVFELQLLLKTRGLVALQRSRAENPVPNLRAGCPQWTGRGTFVDTGLVACSGLGFQELLQTRELVALQWFRARRAFVDTGLVACSGLGLQER